MSSQKVVFCLSLLLVFSGCKNPLGGGRDSSQVDSAYHPGLPGNTTTLTEFTHNFDYSVPAEYTSEDGAAVDSGTASLIPRDVIDDSTDISGTDLNFAHNSSASGNLSVASNKVSMTSGLTASFVSRVMDGVFNPAAWTKFSLQTSLPFGKEIITSAETGYGSTVENLSSGLVGLWHLNEPASTSGGGSVVDSTSTGNNGTPAGTVAFAQAAPLSTGIYLNGSNWIDLSSSGFPVGGASRTTAAWFKRDAATGNRAIFAYGSNSGGALWEVMAYNGTIILHAHGGGNDTLSVPAPFSDGVWTHVAIKYVSGVVSVYVDGVNRGTAGMPLSTGSDFFRIGGAGYFPSWIGFIDEVGVWNRGLSDTEVQQLYRRGANRVKFQVRACDDGTCSTNPDFVGPNGANTTYFTELNNTATTSFSIPWSTFASANTGFNTWFNANKTKKFVQYSAVLESDSATLFPSITSASFSPDEAFSSANPTVVNKVTIAPDFKELREVLFTEIGTCAGVHYDIGNSASTFFKWNGSAWVASSNYASALPKATLEGLTESQWKLFPTGSGKLFVRSHLGSDGTSTCSVDNVFVRAAK